MEKKIPIIIIKKKGGHGAHHGGAWKVAYADFVTAMMALFIVLWLLSSNKPVQEAVGGYFRDPSGSSKKIGTNLSGSGESFSLTPDNMAQLQEQLQKQVQRMADFEKLKDQISMTVTAEGLRVELLESASGTFFDSGKSTPNASGRELLVMLAHELGAVPNKISIEGHTDAKPYPGSQGYSNWELSTDRANGARRLMQASGIRPDQVSQVRGYADQRLRKPDPLDPSNRRISVIVQYIAKNDEAGGKSSEEKPAGEPPEAANPGEGGAPKE
jgi:chemotaxis protein MotB